MKTLLSNYTFAPSTRQITLSDLDAISLERLLLITNTTTNKIIYNFADSTYGASNVSGNIITLSYDTSLMSSSDKLQIYYDTEFTFSSDEAIILLRRLVKLCESNGTVDSSNRQRVSLDNYTIAAGTNTTTTVNVGGISQVSCNYPNASPFTNGIVYPVPVYETPVDQRWRIIDAARTAYAAGIRNNLIS